MNYDFPIIHNISEIKEAIKGYDEFIIKHDETENLLIVNYLFTTENSFVYPPSCDDAYEYRLAALRKECRGIEFDALTGDIVTRKFHKFHNVNERPEYATSNIDLSKKHWILPKLDGSMITFFIVGDEIVAHTKMGSTNVAKPINKFVKESKHKYKPFIMALIINGYTPIFEWCSYNQKIVVHYEEEQLILTAIRNTITGEYVPVDEMIAEANSYDVPVITPYEYNVNINDFVNYTKGVKSIEGFIIRFEDGHMCKLKADWYVKIHNTFDTLRFEKNVIDILLNDLLDDILPLVTDETKKALIDYNNDFYNNLSLFADRIKNIVDDNKHLSKKDFALNVANRLSPSEKGLAYGIFDGHEPIDSMKKYIKKNISSSNKVEAVKHMFGNINWNQYYKSNFSD